MAARVCSRTRYGIKRLRPGGLKVYNIARGSTAEVRSLLYVIEDNYPKSAVMAVALRNEIVSVGRLVSGLIRSTEERKTVR